MGKIIFNISILLFFISNKPIAQQTQLYPSNWWIGMKWNKVQILVYNNQKSIKNIIVKIAYPGVVLNKIHRLENEKYLALDVTVSATAKPGNVNIIFIENSKTTLVQWALQLKQTGNGITYAKGITSFLILVMNMLKLTIII